METGTVIKESSKVESKRESSIIFVRLKLEALKMAYCE